MGPATASRGAHNGKSRAEATMAQGETYIFSVYSVCTVEFLVALSSLLFTAQSTQHICIYTVEEPTLWENFDQQNAGQSRVRGVGSE
jgi:hypothetical protein